MPEPGEVVIVSGPPGSGKTTVAAALAAEAARGVHLESDWFYRSIRSGFVAPHLSEAHAQNTAVIDVATDAAAGYAHAGYSVVWDGVLGPWFLDRVARRLASRRVALHYLVLRPARQTALDRVRRRDRTNDISGAHVMFDQFADLGELECHVVDSDAPPAAVLARCREALGSAGLRVDSTVWVNDVWVNDVWVNDVWVNDVWGNDVWVDDRWPVSVKGLLGWGGRFVVLRNRRDEWELPGGRLDATDPDPASALRREMAEELGLDVVVGAPVDSWIYDIEGTRVLILTHRCVAERPAVLAHGDEHTGIGLFTVDELASEPIPAGYLRSIRIEARNADDR